MTIVDVYNKEEVIRLLGDALSIFLGEKIDRISWEIGEHNEIVVIIDGKKWSIKVDDYKEKEDEI